MIRRPPRSTRTDTLFPYTTLFRSVHPGENSLQRKFMAPNGMASEMNKLVSIAALLAVPLSACTTVGPDYDAPGAGALNVPASYYSVEATPGDRKSTRLNSSH